MDVKPDAVLSDQRGLKEALALLWTRTARSIWLGLACAAVAYAVGLLSLFTGLEDWMHDASFNWRGVRASRVRDRIVLVTLDQESLRRLGKTSSYLSPELAAVVRHLKRQGAAAVGIDLLIPEDLDRTRRDV